MEIHRRVEDVQKVWKWVERSYEGNTGNILLQGKAEEERSQGRPARIDDVRKWTVPSQDEEVAIGMEEECLSYLNNRLDQWRSQGGCERTSPNFRSSAFTHTKNDK